MADPKQKKTAKVQQPNQDADARARSLEEISNLDVIVMPRASMGRMGPAPGVQMTPEMWRSIAMLPTYTPPPADATMASPKTMFAPGSVSAPMGLTMMPTQVPGRPPEYSEAVQGGYYYEPSQNAGYPMRFPDQALYAPYPQPTPMQPRKRYPVYPPLFTHE